MSAEVENIIEFPIDRITKRHDAKVVHPFSLVHLDRARSFDLFCASKIINRLSEAEQFFATQAMIGLGEDGAPLFWGVQLDAFAPRTSEGVLLFPSLEVDIPQRTVEFTYGDANTVLRDVTHFEVTDGELQVRGKNDFAKANILTLRSKPDNQEDSQVQGRVILHTSYWKDEVWRNGARAFFRKRGIEIEYF